MNAPLSADVRALLFDAEFCGPLPLLVQYQRALDAAARGEDGAGREVFRLQCFVHPTKSGPTAWERAPLTLRAKLAGGAGSHRAAHEEWRKLPTSTRAAIRARAWSEAQELLAIFRCGELS